MCKSQVSLKSEPSSLKQVPSIFFLGKSSHRLCQVKSKSSPVVSQVKSKSSHLIIVILPAESDLNKVKRQDISNFYK